MDRHWTGSVLALAGLAALAGGEARGDSVGGYRQGGLEALAPVVDSVLNDA